MPTVQAVDTQPSVGHPIVNTHVHVPPNFSAFGTPEEAVAFAAAGGARVVGVSNFHDHRVYGRFGAAARRAGILPLFGLEIIAVVESLRIQGTRINDPANPGRMYLCGKGIDPLREPSAVALRIAGTARRENEARARAMVALLRDRFAAAGLATALDDTAIVGEVAARAGVPADWVVLQERHLAMAFQAALFDGVAPGRRTALLERAFGGSTSVPVEDPVAVQGEIRSRLLKAGCPAFVPESAMTFEDARRLVLEWGGIPAYPTLADGTDPVCPWEDPPERLARRLLDRRILMAELIPGRNEPSVVDAYVAAFRAAGIVVTAGTEHNTPERVPIEPACRGGRPLSGDARAAFREGAYVIAAHQHERSAGRAGFVDHDGEPAGAFPDHEARIGWFARLGARLVDEEAGT
jgi:hypothetical protein